MCLNTKGAIKSPQDPWSTSAPPLCKDVIVSTAERDAAAHLEVEDLQHEWDDQMRSLGLSGGTRAISLSQARN